MSTSVDVLPRQHCHYQTDINYTGHVYVTFQVQDINFYSHITKKQSGISLSVDLCSFSLVCDCKAQIVLAQHYSCQSPECCSGATSLIVYIRASRAQTLPTKGRQRATRITFSARKCGQKFFYSTVLPIAWSRTEEGIHEARVAKHAFEEFAVISKGSADSIRLTPKQHCIVTLFDFLSLLPQCCKNLTVLCCAIIFNPLCLAIVISAFASLVLFDLAYSYNVLAVNCA